MPLSVGRPAPRLAPIVALLALAGCDSDPYRLGKTAPVRGRVMVGDVPLHHGIVTFQPDASRGNRSPHQPSASIDENGYYELFTVGKSAAPLGHYKITIMAYETDADIAKRAQSPGEAGRKVERLVHRKYESPATTPLALEVVEDAAPGAYDLKLTR